MIKVFSTFTGIGSPEMALKKLNIPFEMMGISESDKYSLIAYNSIHNEDIETDYPDKETMLKEFKDKNIAFNYSTGKSEIPRKDEDIRKLYKAHILNKNYGDISKIDEKNIPDFDLFIYSPPCQDISVAGNQLGLKKDSRTRSSLLWECERIIRYKKPKYLLMENVKNIIGKGHKYYFHKWINTLESIGYTSYYKVMNACDYGIPQNRERVIMVSIRKDLNQKFYFPESIELKKFLKDILEKDVDNKYYIKKDNNYVELPHQDISYCIDANYYKGTSIDNFVSKCRIQLIQVKTDIKLSSFDSKNRIYDTNGLSPTLLVSSDGQPKILDVVRTPLRFLKRNGKVEGNDYSFCVDTTNTGGVKEILSDNTNRVRKLTPLECWRLMGYSDDDFYKAKNSGLSETKLYEKAGNGIVVDVLMFVFKALFLNYRDEPKQTELF